MGRGAEKIEIQLSAVGIAAFVGAEPALPSGMSGSDRLGASTTGLSVAKMAAICVSHFVASFGTVASENLSGPVFRPGRFVMRLLLLKLTGEFEPPSRLQCLTVDSGPCAQL